MARLNCFGDGGFAFLSWTGPCFVGNCSQFLDVAKQVYRRACCGVFDGKLVFGAGVFERYVFSVYNEPSVVDNDGVTAFGGDSTNNETSRLIRVCTTDEFSEASSAEMHQGYDITGGY